MQKNLWKGLFRPENKKLRSNIFLALLAGVLLLAMGKSFFGGEKEAPAGGRCGGCHADLLQDGGTHHCTG